MLSLQYSFTSYLQNLILTGLNNISKKLVTLEVVMLPADYTSRVGISKMFVFMKILKLITKGNWSVCSWFVLTILFFQVF